MLCGERYKYEFLHHVKMFVKLVVEMIRRCCWLNFANIKTQFINAEIEAFCAAFYGKLFFRLFKLEPRRVH
jgi:hypothetical protein